jgi:hypothetical protein
VFEKVISEEKIIFPCGMSRSGTTLLTTVLDSHSQISLGYELLPAELPEPLVLKENIKAVANELGEMDLVKLGKGLRKKGLNAEGMFAVRVARSGISYEAYLDILGLLFESGFKKTSSLEERFKISYEVVAQKSKQESTSFRGFKLNNASYQIAHKLFPNSYFVYTLRDPRDVWTSHVKREFKRTVEEVCKAWNTYLEKFEVFSKEFPNKAVLIRYEDLVTTPKDSINHMFKLLPLDVEESVFEFYKSNATVHSAGHPNADQLSQNFFTSSIHSWKGSISSEEQQTIENICGNLMSKYNY